MNYIIEFLAKFFYDGKINLNNPLKLMQDKQK